MQLSYGIQSALLHPISPFRCELLLASGRMGGLGRILQHEGEAMLAIQLCSGKGLGRACAALALAHRTRAVVADPRLRRRLHSLPAGTAALGSNPALAAMLPARACLAPGRAVPSGSWLSAGA